MKQLDSNTYSFAALFAAVLILFGTNSTAAQLVERKLLPFTVTAYSGLNLNMHSTDFFAVPGFGGYGSNFTQGSGFGVTVGIGSEYFPKARLFGLEYRTGCSILFSVLSGRLEKQDFIGNVIQGNSNSKALVQTSINASLSAALAEPYIALNPFSDLPLTVKIGMQAGITLSGTMTRREELISPEGVTFETGSRLRNEKTGNIPDKSSLYTAGIAALRYEVPLSHTTTLMPEAAFSIALNDISPSLSWKTNIIRAGLTFAYRPAEPTPDAPPPPPPPIPKEKILKIAANMRINGMIYFDGQTITVPMQETRIETRYSIAPVVYFAPQSEVVLSEDKISGLPNKQSNVIESIAAYLRTNPTSKITITAYYADDEMPEIAQKRGKAIVEALRRNTADFGNITVVIGDIPLKMRRPDMRDETRRATFEINGKPIIFPYTEPEQVIVQADNIIVEAKPDFSASELPATVTGELRFAGKTVASLGQSITKYVIDSKYLTNNSSSKTISAEYILQDNEGNIKTSTIRCNIQTAPVQAAKIVNRDETAGYEQYVLGYFDFDAAEFSSVDSFSVGRVRTALRDGKSVEIIGLTDDIGTEEYNKRLAQQRIISALNLLGTTENRITSTILAPIFPRNSTPNSRTINRSVVVRIR